MKKYTWIVALLIALSLAVIGCPSGIAPPGPVEPSDDLEDVVIEGEDIVITAIGGAAKAPGVVVDKNTLSLTAVSSSSIGFAYNFPAEIKGKGYGTIIVELELLEVTRPDFIAFNAKEDTQIQNDVLIVGHTQQYHNELKIGTITDKAVTDPCSKAACLIYTAGSCIVGAKGSAEYPLSKFKKDLIAFQYNSYADDITTADWTKAGDSATFKIAVTKITFPGGKPVEPEPEPDPLKKGDVVFSLADWLKDKPDGAAGTLPDGLVDAGGPTLTIASGKLVINRDTAWKGIDIKSSDVFDFDKYLYKIEIKGSATAGSGNNVQIGMSGQPYGGIASAAAGGDFTLTKDNVDAGALNGRKGDNDYTPVMHNVRLNSNNGTFDITVDSIEITVAEVKE